METCKSPRMVMRAAYVLAQRALPAYTSKYRRHDFTLPQLFACLVLREHQKKTYRGTEALLRGCPDWLADIELARVPRPQHGKASPPARSVARVETEQIGPVSPVGEAFVDLSPQATEITGLKDVIVKDSGTAEIIILVKYIKKGAAPDGSEDTVLKEGENKFFLKVSPKQ